MPSFSQPFSVMDADRRLTGPELVRAIRFMVAAEYEAIQLYTETIETTDNQLAIDVLREITDDERHHAGAFLRLLFALDPAEEKYYGHGAAEVESFFQQAPDSCRDILHEKMPGD